MTERTGPNLFELRGTDGTQITYSTTSISGAPRLSYSGPKGEKSYAGNEIERSDTELGTEVTVWLDEVSDGDSLVLTLLVPPFGATSDGANPLDTIAILTTKRSSISGPPPGVTFTYEPVALSGEAKLVEF